MKNTWVVVWSGVNIGDGEKSPRTGVFGAYQDDKKAVQAVWDEIKYQVHLDKEDLEEAKSDKWKGMTTEEIATSITVYNHRMDGGWAFWVDYEDGTYETYVVERIPSSLVGE